MQVHHGLEQVPKAGVARCLVGSARDKYTACLVQRLLGSAGPDSKMWQTNMQESCNVDSRTSVVVLAASLPETNREQIYRKMSWPVLGQIKSDGELQDITNGAGSIGGHAG